MKVSGEAGVINLALVIRAPVKGIARLNLGSSRAPAGRRAADARRTTLLFLGQLIACIEGGAEGSPREVQEIWKPGVQDSLE